MPGLNGMRAAQSPERCRIRCEDTQRNVTDGSMRTSGAMHWSNWGPTADMRMRRARRTVRTIMRRDVFTLAIESDACYF